MTYSRSGTRPTKVKRPLESVVTSFGKVYSAEGPLLPGRNLDKTGIIPARGRPARSTSRPDTVPHGRSFGHERARLRVLGTASDPASRLPSHDGSSRIRIRWWARPVTRKTACCRDCHQHSRIEVWPTLVPLTIAYRPAACPSGSRILMIGSGAGTSDRSHWYALRRRFRRSIGSSRLALFR